MTQMTKMGKLFHGQDLHGMLCLDWKLIRCCTSQGSQHLKGRKIIYAILSFFIVLALIDSILNGTL